MSEHEKLPFGQEELKKIQEGLAKITENYRYKFNDPPGYMPNVINQEGARLVKPFIDNQDIIIFSTLKEIYIKSDDHLHLLPFLPFVRPEVDHNQWMLILNENLIGVVTFNGLPEQPDPMSGIVNVGYRTEIKFNEPLKYIDIDIDLSLSLEQLLNKEDNDNEQKNE
ncbi:MAG: hypothetical protein NC548_12910 [Lachnospiraceae bacterium]|nr:hypothetical protein [Lachnospiraceae bacterium]MCM1230709.1 hypothetical protein [Ruminococcus flavefaciens]